MWFIELLDVILYPLRKENFYAVGDCLKTVIWWDDACHRIALNTFHLLKSTAREGESGKCDHHTNTISISNFEISCHRVGAVCLAALITNFKWSRQKAVTQRRIAKEQTEFSVQRWTGMMRHWCDCEHTHLHILERNSLPKDKNSHLNLHLSQTWHNKIKLSKTPTSLLRLTLRFSIKPSPYKINRCDWSVTNQDR